MNVYPNISYTAKLLSEPTRGIILESLMDGTARPASELASLAGVSHPTMSSHLSKLVEGNMLAVEHQGRHRYYKLANKEVAELIEKLGTIAPPVQITSLRQSNRLKHIRFARTCYDHLAGELGVKITEALLQKAFIEESNKHYVVTARGKEWFLDLGIDIRNAQLNRRIFAKPCLDWSERRHHLSGWLGAALAKCFFDQGWMTKAEESRAVYLTTKGVAALEELLDVRFDKKAY
ncbi:winged helix-turn-helix domain-containing protein [Bacillus sp. JCM 19041]|uniref:ArsR/SmtB family transcription factor n=1 Tax=Bacillus sp. JCM 19041 TaxID=1460637 RepID=UPI0006D0D807